MIADALSCYPVDPPEADTEVEAAISTFGTDPLIAELREAAGDSYRDIHQAVKSGTMQRIYQDGSSKTCGASWPRPTMYS